MNTVNNSPNDPSLLKVLQGHKERINNVLFHPNLKQVISCSNDGTIFAWGLGANARPNKFLGHQGPVCDISINP